MPQGRRSRLIIRRFDPWTILKFSVLLYLSMAATARALTIEAPPLRLWWYGGSLLIGVEFAVHAVMAIRGLPNFYNGRG